MPQRREGLRQRRDRLPQWREGLRQGRARLSQRREDLPQRGNGLRQGREGPRQRGERLRQTLLCFCQNRRGTRRPTGETPVLRGSPAAHRAFQARALPPTASFSRFRSAAPPRSARVVLADSALQQLVWRKSCSAKQEMRPYFKPRRAWQKKLSLFFRAPFSPRDAGARRSDFAPRGDHGVSRSRKVPPRQRFGSTAPTSRPMPSPTRAPSGPKNTAAVRMRHAM